MEKKQTRSLLDTQLSMYVMVRVVGLSQTA